MGRFGTPEEAAAAIAFLASDDSGFIATAARRRHHECLDGARVTPPLLRGSRQAQQTTRPGQPPPVRPRRRGLRAESLPAQGAPGGLRERAWPAHRSPIPGRARKGCRAADRRTYRRLLARRGGPAPVTERAFENADEAIQVRGGEVDHGPSAGAGTSQPSKTMNPLQTGVHLSRPH